MGCCSSKEGPKPKPYPQSKPQPQQPPPPPALTLEEKNAIALEGLKNALHWAVDEAVATTSTEAYWRGAPMDVPFQEKADRICEKLQKVPIAGKKAAEKISTKVVDIKASQQEGGQTLAADPKTKAAFTSCIDALTIEKAVELIGSGNVHACVDHLDEQSHAVLRAELYAVSKKTLLNSKATRDYDDFVKNYNAAANILPGGALDPIDENLYDYVTCETLKRIIALMKEKEAIIRAAPQQAVNARIAEVFGKKPEQWQK